MVIKHSYKELERQRRESDILAAAERLLIEGGYGSLNMDDLASQVGISKPTLYQHFHSKEELTAQVLLRSFAFLDDFVAEPLDTPAIDRLCELLRRFLAMQAPGTISASLRPDAHPHLMMMTAIRHMPEFEKRKQQFVQNISVLVEKAKAEGAIGLDIPTPIVAHLLIALGQSLARQSMQTPLANSPAQVELLVESVLRVFLRGITPLPPVVHPGG